MWILHPPPPVAPCLSFVSSPAIIDARPQDDIDFNSDLEEEMKDIGFSPVRATAEQNWWKKHPNGIVSHNKREKKTVGLLEGGTSGKGQGGGKGEGKGRGKGKAESKPGYALIAKPSKEATARHDLVARRATFARDRHQAWGGGYGGAASTALVVQELA